MFLVLTGIALLLSNVAAAMLFLLFGILASLAMLFLWIVLSHQSVGGRAFRIAAVRRIGGADAVKVSGVQVLGLRKTEMPFSYLVFPET